MTSEEIARQRAQAEAEKRMVALTSVLAAVGLTGMKLVVGLLTRSLGILSEAAHSGLDLVAAAVTFYAVRAAGRPADREHTYGHGKIENLSALFETVLLLVTCIWIVSEGIERLFFKHVEVEASLWAFLAVIVSIGVDFTRSRALSRVARKYASQALEADALHFSTDIWSSAVVLLGLVFVLVGRRTGIGWLAQADAVAALGVAAIVIGVSYRLGRKTVNDLLDAVPSALRSQIRNAARVPGVLEVGRARVRRAGAEVFADLTLNVDRRTSLEKAHDIASAAETAVRDLYPGADVVVHVDPVPGETEGVQSRVRLLAERLGLGVHELRIHEVGGRDFLDMHVEAEDSLTVEEAHRKVDRLERAVVVALPWIDGIVSHIEPVGERSARQQGSAMDQDRVAAALAAIAHETGVRFEPHEILVRRAGERLSLSFHCLIEDTTALTDAHEFADELERRLRARIPELGRIVIHTEPRRQHESG